MPRYTPLTPEQAAQVFCPLVQGACKGGECHFWLWDTTYEKKIIPWPEDIARPRLEISHMYHLISKRDARMRFGEMLREAISPLIGRPMHGGKVVDVGIPDPGLKSLNVTIQIRETGDCCLRRAAQQGADE